MDSREILKAVEEATTSEKISKDTLTRETRVDLMYSDDTLFDQPVAIRGTNKQFLPFENLISFDGEDKCSVNEVMDMCRKVDDNLCIKTVENISDIGMEFVNNTHIVLSYTDLYVQGGEDKVTYFVIPTYCGDSKKEMVAFKKWSELLKVPYSYSKKNPGFLNEANFSYWKKILTDAQDQQIPIDLIYMKDSIQITIEKEVYAAEKLEETVEAYVVVNILKSEVVYEKKNIVEVTHSEITDRVPMMSKILNNVQNQINSINPDINVNMQQYSLGYTGTNKGRHYVRLVLENTGVDFDINGQEMFPAVSIESDFLGRCNDFGDVVISFGLFREVCSNGLVVNWNEQQKKEMREQFVLNYCNNRGTMEGREDYIEIVGEATSKFNTLFSGSGIKIPVSLANSAFVISLFKQIFEFFIGSVSYMKKSLDELTVDFGEINEYEFVSTIHNVAGSMKISSDIIKYLIIEYIAGAFSNQHQYFQTPLDVVNFLTYICKAYDSSIQLETERKAYMFAYVLMQILIYKKKKDNSIYENYLRKVNKDIL